MRVVHVHSELSGVWGGVFVPTMGALHEGHASLVRRGASLARARGAACVVSIFVNPTQFNEPADFARYPKTLEADLACCEAAGADVVYAPAADDVYPPGQQIEVPALPAQAIAPGLEDSRRPGHFAGVCQVVLRLLRIVQPGAAVFGEKDWQQLKVITAMVAGEGLGVEIVPGETVRETDGLAMSSRNRFLTGEDRARAGALHQALNAALGARDPSGAEAVMLQVLASRGIIPEYAVVRGAESLMRPAQDVDADSGGVTRWRALIAARVGGVRLIDNAPWRAGGGAGGAV
ncbi:MAG: pantoate--beta-alanine ligase [Phycisphaeraceae bacterium]|nr:pantoate--beta-alanine ligase [Phycisphaeraceae bacterium]